MTTNTLAADRLNDAYRTGAIPPMRDVLGPLDAEKAYAIQQINTARWIGDGRKVIGRKVGLTAKSVQQQLGVSQPDFGVLFADMAIADGGSLPPQKVLQPKAEGEIAFLIAEDVAGPGVTREQVSAAISGVVAAIEIVDSRIADWKITFADTVADNGSAAFFVLGNDPRPLAEVDLWTCGMVLEINGEIASLGAGAACLGHPLNAVTWLAQTLAARGEHLRKGDLILSGALAPMMVITPGDKVKVSIGGLGSVSFAYGDDR